jgi:hypothetical protein
LLKTNSKSSKEIPQNCHRLTVVSPRYEAEISLQSDMGGAETSCGIYNAVSYDA